MGGEVRMRAYQYVAVCTRAGQGLSVMLDALPARNSGVAMEMIGCMASALGIAWILFRR
jgi:alkylation response protein AidB-like acyl-CoA dehydrogenase